MKKGAKPVITTPFEDDFNLITHDKKLHQELLTDIESNIKSIGLVIKPQKCGSLSIVGGRTVNIEFNLRDEIQKNNICIESVIDKPLKFLGQRFVEQTHQVQCL